MDLNGIRVPAFKLGPDWAQPEGVTLTHPQSGLEGSWTMSITAAGFTVFLKLVLRWFSD